VRGGFRVLHLFPDLETLKFMRSEVLCLYLLNWNRGKYTSDPTEIEKPAQIASCLYMLTSPYTLPISLTAISVLIAV